MGWSNWFGTTRRQQPVGKAQFNIAKTHSQQSYQQAIKNLSYRDRQKAQALDQELRSQAKHKLISQRQYLAAAYKKYGSNFKKKLKDQAFTNYITSNPVLEERRRRRNIFETQQSRAKEYKKNSQVAGPRFANSVQQQGQATASRLGAQAGQAAPRPTSREIDRSIWQR